MTRVLGIAPYEGLKNIMDAVAQLDDEIMLISHVGDYKDGLKLVAEIDCSDYDVIISRGGTADLIQEYSPIPVLSIEMSYYDILNATTLAQSFDKPFALVGFPSTVRAASMLYDILKYDIPIYTTNNDEEVEATLIELRKRNIHVVVGDTMITRHADQQGMQSILIASGSESVAESFRQAAIFSKYQQYICRENAFYQTAAKLTHRNLLVLGQDSKIAFSNMTSAQKSSFYPLVKKLHPAVLQHGYQQVLRHIHKKSMLITADKFMYGKEQLTAFELMEIGSFFSARFSAVTMKEKEEISNSFLRMFYNLTPGSDFYKKTASCLNVRTVVITGETGTGKKELAEYLYHTGRFSRSVLFTIDCSNLTESNFDTLFRSSESPVFRKGHVLYFHNFQFLAPNLRQQALQHLLNGNIALGNQLIFSVARTHIDDGYIPQCAQDILSSMPSVLIDLPPLRKRIHEIPSFITLYLNALASHSIHQLAGIEPEGITHLQGFFWNENLRQLCRVLDTLSQLTTTPYIRTKDVRDILETEHRLSRSAPISGSVININQPLNEIITDVIHMVLAQEGMNQTKAAKQLGICRATLWKYLKSD